MNDTASLQQIYEVLFYARRPVKAWHSWPNTKCNANRCHKCNNITNTHRLIFRKIIRLILTVCMT